MNREAIEKILNVMMNDLKLTPDKYSVYEKAVDKLDNILQLAEARKTKEVAEELVLKRMDGHLIFWGKSNMDDIDLIVAKEVIKDARIACNDLITKANNDIKKLEGE